MITSGQPPFLLTPSTPFRITGNSIKPFPHLHTTQQYRNPQPLLSPPVASLLLLDTPTPSAPPPPSRGPVGPAAGPRGRRASSAPFSFVSTVTSNHAVHCPRGPQYHTPPPPTALIPSGGGEASMWTDQPPPSPTEEGGIQSWPVPRPKKRNQPSTSPRGPWRG